MYAVTAIPDLNGLNREASRVEVNPLAPEPGQSFADYLAVQYGVVDEHSRDDRSGSESRVQDTRDAEMERSAEKITRKDDLEAKESSRPSTEADPKAGEKKAEAREKDRKDIKMERAPEGAESLIAVMKKDDRHDSKEAESPRSFHKDDAGKPESLITAKETPRPSDSREVKQESDKTGSEVSEHLAGEAAMQSAEGERKADERSRSKDAAGEDDRKVSLRDSSDPHAVPPDEGRTGYAASAAGETLSLSTGKGAQGAQKRQDGTARLENTEGDSRPRGREVREAGHRDRTGSAPPPVREIVVNLGESKESAGREDAQAGEIREISVRLDGAAGNGLPRSGGAEIHEATATLARRLNGSLGDNIVRQAQVIMKEAGQGEIRLVIRPPELGRVRILLEMDQGHIAGRILVDNQSVRQVVEQNLAALQRAFQEAGLEMGDLEVSTGDARQEADRDSRQAGDSDGRRPAAAGADQFGRSVKSPVEYDYGVRRINLVA